MKIKMFLFLVLTILFIFLINLSNQDKKIYYVNIDTVNNMVHNKEIYNKLKKINKLEKYVNIQLKDYRTTDLINEIEDNKKINKKNIQNHLIKADILVLNVGTNDINYKINSNKDELYEYTDQVLEDIEKLLKLIRIYDKEKIYFLGFKNTLGISYNEYFEYTNKVLKSICNGYNVIFIDINNNENIIDKIFTK